MCGCSSAGGEYFAAIATSLFLLEIYELTEKVTPVRIAALGINLAAGRYLLVAKRLFGIRGGHGAYQAAQW